MKYRHAEVEKIHTKAIVITKSTLKLSSSKSHVMLCWTSNILNFIVLQIFLSVPVGWIRFRPKLSLQNENYT